MGSVMSEISIIYSFAPVSLIRPSVLMDFGRSKGSPRALSQTCKIHGLLFNQFIF